MNYDEVIAFMKNFAQRFYFPGTSGNVSVRLDNDKIAITERSLYKAFVKDSSFVIVGIDGNYDKESTKRSSTELEMHLAIYRKRSDIAAIVHAHPPYSTYYAAISRIPTYGLLPESENQIGKIMLSKYYLTGTTELAMEVAKNAESSNAILLERHGVVTIGKSVKDAFIRMDMVEFLCRISYMASRGEGYGGRDTP